MTFGQIVPGRCNNCGSDTHISCSTVNPHWVLALAERQSPPSDITILAERLRAAEERIRDLEERLEWHVYATEGAHQ